MSNDIRFRPFGKQKEVLKSDSRILGVFCGKRSGKTEVGAIKSCLLQENKPNAKFFNDQDVYLGGIIAPTHEMVKRLSWAKFLAYAKPFIKREWKTPLMAEWHDGSMVYGLSADRPARIEGLKLGWSWCDEVLQMSEQMFLEVKARTADTEGYILCTGSLGVQFVNPKNHWAYRYFKESPDKNTQCFEWNTLDNPYFPREEIENLKNTLDPTTFRQMFELDWDTTPKSAVYSDFNGELNVDHAVQYNPQWKTYAAIDWGWNDPKVCLFIQHDERNDIIYIIDEIHQSKMTNEDFYSRILSRGYKIDEWVCDQAGKQQNDDGFSSVQFFRGRGIRFRTRSTKIAYGIPLVRSYIRDGLGRRRLITSERCKRTIDEFKSYRYPEKDGTVTGDNPMDENNHAMDALRYFFVNILDPALKLKSRVRIGAYA